MLPPSAWSIVGTIAEDPRDHRPRPTLPTRRHTRALTHRGAAR